MRHDCLRRRLPAVLSATLALLSAHEGQAQSPDEALSLAYEFNPELLAERARVRGVDEGVPLALSGWRPTVIVGGSIGVQKFTNEADVSANNSKDTLRPIDLSVTLDQPVYRGGRTVAETDAAEARVLAARDQLSDIEQSVLLDAGIAYMDVVRDQAVVQLNINNEQVLQRRLEATRDRFEGGEVTRTDVAQAEARLADAEASRVAAEGDLQTSRAAFEQVIGQPPEALDFPGPEFLPPLPENGDEARDVALAENPALRARVLLERAALFDISAAAGDLLPNVSIEGRFLKSYEPNSFFNESEVGELLATVRVPLYQAGAAYARVRELRQIAVQRRREIDRTRREVIENTTSSWETLVTTRAAIESFESSVRANEIALEGVQQEAAVGARTTLDVLDAEQELFNARVNLVRARRDEIVASMTLLAAVGRMTARYFDLSVEIYDPTRHYQAVRDKWIGFGFGNN